MTSKAILNNVKLYKRREASIDNWAQLKASKESLVPLKLPNIHEAKGAVAK